MNALAQAVGAIYLGNAQRIEEAKQKGHVSSPVGDQGQSGQQAKEMIRRTAENAVREKLFLIGGQSTLAPPAGKVGTKKAPGTEDLSNAEEYFYRELSGEFMRISEQIAEQNKKLPEQEKRVVLSEVMSFGKGVVGYLLDKFGFEPA